MLTEDDIIAWLDKFQSVKPDVVVSWIKELHPNATDFRLNIGPNTFPGERHIGFMDETHMCSISISDPPAWLVWRVCQYDSNN